MSNALLIPVVDDYSLNMYVKYIGYATDNHSAMQIKRNSDWLLVQYGFKAVPLNSEMSGADAAAIAWCIARNMEQSSGLEMQKKLFKKGLKQGVEGGADITEEYEQDTPNLDMSTDGDGGISEPFIGNLTDAIYYTDPTGAYVKMYLDMSWTETSASGEDHKEGRVVYEAYDNNGVLIDSTWTIGTSGWSWHMFRDSGYHMSVQVVKVSINGSKVICTHKEVFGDGRTYYYNVDWSPTGSSVASIMSNAVKVGNIPPDIIT